jgi:hypothetical protein
MPTGLCPRVQWAARHGSPLPTPTASNPMHHRWVVPRGLIFSRSAPHSLATSCATWRLWPRREKSTTNLPIACSLGEHGHRVAGASERVFTLGGPRHGALSWIKRMALPGRRPSCVFDPIPMAKGRWAFRLVRCMAQAGWPGRRWRPVVAVAPGWLDPAACSARSLALGGRRRFVRCCFRSSCGQRSRPLWRCVFAPLARFLWSQWFCLWVPARCQRASSAAGQTGCR